MLIMCEKTLSGSSEMQRFEHPDVQHGINSIVVGSKNSNSAEV